MPFDTHRTRWYNLSRQFADRRKRMNKRRKVANRKHRQRMRRLEQRRKESVRAGAERLSKSRLHRLAGPPIPPVPR